MHVTLDGSMMHDKSQAHRLMQSKLAVDEYYGNNLDALYDVLSTYDRVLTVTWVNIEAMKASLGDYAEQMLHIFTLAAAANTKVKVYMVR